MEEGGREGGRERTNQKKKKMTPLAIGGQQGRQRKSSGRVAERKMRGKKKLKKFFVL